MGPLQAKNLIVTRVTPVEIFLHWDPPDDFSSTSFHHYFVTILDTKANKSEALSVEKVNTTTVIGNLKPYHQYQIHLFSVAEKGSLSCLEKPILIITGVSPPRNVSARSDDVGEDSIILQWEPPHDSFEFYIQAKSVSDASETIKHLVNNTNKFKIDLLTPGMTYDIGVATVKNGNKSELITIQKTLKPKPVQIIIPYEFHSTSVIFFVQMPDIGVFDGIYIITNRGPNITVPLKSNNKITIENLTPGTEYNFLVSTISGDRLSTMYRVPSVKTCLEVPLNIREGRVTDTSIQILWDRVDGNFQHYEITCTNCADAVMVQKVIQENAIFSNLAPATIYNFSIRTEKEGFKDSIPRVKEIQTAPSAVEYMNHSRDSTSITVTWLPAKSVLDGYIISIANEGFMKEEMLYSTESMFKFIGLAPGTDFLISIVTTNGLKKSQPTVLRASTFPEPPSDFQVFGEEENTIYLSWKLPQGGFDKFQRCKIVVNDTFRINGVFRYLFSPVLPK
ncbi:tenascin-R-like [Sminthopsis crassicaudata]|uniref:tenascin-R-like n=1 Tax=Sminthopsis crassicaudata TaxID=9301 RepID=UPI003D68448D